MAEPDMRILVGEERRKFFERMLQYVMGFHAEPWMIEEWYARLRDIDDDMLTPAQRERYSFEIVINQILAKQLINELKAMEG
jgi:hypothetical protein